MTVTGVEKDMDQLTMTVTAEFGVGPERAWELWSDPRQLERWWGPPTYPATVVDHDFTPGGLVSYYMTGPEGDVHRGWWRMVEIEEPTRLVIVDGFAGEDGKPADGLPAMTFTVTFVPTDSGGTVMTIRTEFPSLPEMQQMLEMGMEEGITLAMGQIDGILAVSTS